MSMKNIGLIAIITAGLSPAVVVQAGESTVAPRIGDTYEIVMTRDSVQGGPGSSGSSNDKDAIVERVVGARSDGLELEYDLPQDATAHDRTTNWQFPARVFKPFHGPDQLLNSPQLEARVDHWLKGAGLPRTACGHWIFTWNAFRIECDPQSVLKTIEAFDLRSADLREGAAYHDAEALSPGTLAKKAAGTDCGTFTAEMPVDPDVVRHARAESEVAAAEIFHKPMSLVEALSKHSKDIVSGTISVTVETDSAGNVRRRTRVIKLDIKGPDGQSETKTVTETLERHLIL